MLRASLGRKPESLVLVSMSLCPISFQIRVLMQGIHGKDTSAASDIEDNLVLEDMLVVDDRPHVGSRADFILL